MDKDKLVEMGVALERAAVNHAYRYSTTSEVSRRMSVPEMFRIAAALRSHAQPK